jgi:coproporphyrinogen oxidase (EC 1.3.3.3)
LKIEAVKTYLKDLQVRIVGALEGVDGQPFRSDAWVRDEGGGGLSRLIEDGAVFERGGVNYSHVTGTTLPPSATQHRPELAGRKWEATGTFAGTASAQPLRAQPCI